MTIINHIENKKVETENLMKSLQEIPAIIKSSFELFTRNINDALNSLPEQLQTLIENIKAGFEERFPKEVQPIISALADRGWFVSDEIGFSSLLEIKTLLDANDEEVINNKFAAWITSSIPAIECSIKEMSPKRLSIISAAIRAHQNKEYQLSVPVLLIQAEGICLDLLKVKLFSRRRGVPATKSELEDRQLSQFTKSFLVPLLEGSGVMAQESERHKYSSCFNRHEILHGIDTDYANEMNSLKALSLIWYLCTFVAKAVSSEQ